MADKTFILKPQFFLLPIIVDIILLISIGIGLSLIEFGWQFYILVGIFFYLLRHLIVSNLSNLEIVFLLSEVIVVKSIFSIGYFKVHIPKEKLSLRFTRDRENYNTIFIDGLKIKSYYRFFIEIAYDDKVIGYGTDDSIFEELQNEYNSQ